MWWQDFHFLRPFWLLALIIPIIVYLKFTKYNHEQSAWQNVCDENLLNFLLVKGTDKRSHWVAGIATLTITAMIIALSGPTWMKKNNPALSVENPVMILLNMSGDMWRKDVSPSRIVRGKYLIKDLVSVLKNTESGLIVYSREPFMITPLTEDASIIDNLLPALEMNIMPENGDRLDRAIDLAVERMKNASLITGNIIVITSDVGERFDAALESAAKAADSGFDVNIINVNSQKNDKLQMISGKGRGLYLDYKQSLSPLVKKINDITLKEIKQSENMQTVWNDMGWYFLWGPALLLLSYFKRGVMLVIFLCLVLSSQAQAGLFQNNNQEALQKFNRQEYSEALKQFSDTRWKGASAYRNGDYASAYENFSKEEDVTSLYNQGNALAKSGKIEEAIKKYEAALQKQPDFDDAKFNLEYLKKQQNKQKQDQNQNRKNNDNEQQQKQDQQQNSAQQEQENPQQAKNDKQQTEQQKESCSDSQSVEQQEDQKEKSDDGQSQSSQGDNQKKQENKPTQSDQKKDKQEKQQQHSGDSSQQNDKQQEEQSQASSDEKKNTEKEKIENMALTSNEDSSSEKQEKLRAKMQKFRKIPEDKGGLLRAFIKKEYDKKRYEN